MKSFDLTSLDKLEIPGAGETAEPTGKAQRLKLADIIEDPDQPRKVFDEQAMAELTANVKKRGVKSPISVKPKNADGKYLINFGHRRYRASIAAGLLDIPAFIDEEFKSSDQIAENLNRADLKPFELADAIVKELARGVSAAELAAEYGKSKAWISQFVSIADAPAFLREAAHKFKDPTVVYQLIGAHKKTPQAIEEFVANSEFVSRGTLSAFLKPEPVAAPAPGPAAAPPPAAATSSEIDNAGQQQSGAAMSERSAGEAQQQGAAAAESKSTPAAASAPAKADAGQVKKSEKENPPTSAGKSGSSVETPSDPLESLYAKHAAGDAIDAILAAYKPAELDAIGKPLVKLAKQGKSTTDRDFYSVLVENLRTGAFGSEGVGLYRMSAFVHGKIANDDASAAQIVEGVLRTAGRFVQH